MYKGKYSGKNKRRLTSWATLALALVLTLSVGGTIAYLITNTSAITNTFTPSYVDCLVDESFNGNVKTNVSVKNNGDTEAYIRATVIVTWQDAAGNVYAQAPVKGTDYSISFANGTGWDTDTIDGYYYYTLPVTASQKTGILISECKPLTNAPAEGYTLSVEILAQAIQSTPIKAVTDSWGVTANGTTISK